ncbi:protein MpGH17.21 [Marchantia polymorpha subsp. ruderalis]|uniref:Bulb-type lectin domain-containing protein n=3 Tax=Marchantia polymorpha TaxID=3197 RepID=A0AAF6BZ20_MARPO|nr:hypothetical protein Mp_7g13130 [Marchantia polymorpha subsp. ruderalis]
MADGWTGICFGEEGSNIPSRTQVVQKFRQLGITRVRLYHTYQSTLQAFSNSGIQLTVGITNADIIKALSSVGSARSWVDRNIVPYGSSNIVAVTVGNEVLTSTANNLKNALLPSMKNLREALNLAGESGIKVTTAHAFDVVANFFPPSSGQFADTGRMQPLVNWLASVGSDFICNIHPYFTYMNSNGQITLQFGRLESGSVKDSNNGEIYTNLLAQRLDAVYAALGRLGQGNMRVVVGEIGWPTSGGTATDTDNARIHNQNLVNLARGGTPLKPNWGIQTYIFAMFDENQKAASLQKSWGLYNPRNFQAKYTINFGNSPTLSNRITQGMRLSSGQFVMSKNEVYKFIMQADCNLVLYQNGVTPLWSSHTVCSASDGYLELLSDGNAVVYGGGVARWTSNTLGRNDGAHRIDVQDDGNTVMYNEANQAIWATKTSSGRITQGMRLSSGQFVESKNRVYRFIMQADCNLVLYQTNVGHLWASNTAGCGSDGYMVLQSDGNAVVYAGGVARWASNTWGRNDGAHRIDVQDDGNAVMYNEANQAIWATNTSSGRITQGMRLSSGQFVESKNRAYRFIMQANCNLVLYQTNVGHLWASNTAGCGSDGYMVLQSDGNAVVYAGGVARWASKTWGRNDGAHRIDVQDDGNTVMYNEANKAIWATNTAGSRITQGMRLSSGKFVESRNRVYRFIMQADCNLVLYQTGVGPLWASNTAGRGSDGYMELQSDGNAVVYGGGVALWASNTLGPNDGAHHIDVQDDGNTVMYNKANEAIWATNTSSGCITQGMRLSSGQFVESKNRVYRFIMQTDCNLVLYHIGVGPLWASNTACSRRDGHMELQPDGNAVVYVGSVERWGLRSSADARWASNTWGRNDGAHRIDVQDDGNTVMYNEANEAIWATNTAGR